MGVESKEKRQRTQSAQHAFVCRAQTGEPVLCRAAITRAMVREVRRPTLLLPQGRNGRAVPRRGTPAESPAGVCS